MPEISNRSIYTALVNPALNDFNRNNKTSNLGNDLHSARNVDEDSIDTNELKEKINVVLVDQNSVDKKPSLYEKLLNVSNVQCESAKMDDLDAIHCGKKRNEFVFDIQNDYEDQDKFYNVQKKKFENYIKRMSNKLSDSPTKIIYLYNCDENLLKLCMLVLEEFDPVKNHKSSPKCRDFEFTFIEIEQPGEEPNIPAIKIMKNQNDEGDDEVNNGTSADMDRERERLGNRNRSRI